MTLCVRVRLKCHNNVLSVFVVKKCVSFKENTLNAVLSFSNNAKGLCWLLAVYPLCYITLFLTLSVYRPSRVLFALQ